MYLFPFFCLKDKMDSIMCVTMASNLAELRHYYSHRHGMVRQNLVKSVWFLFVCKNILIIILTKPNVLQAGNTDLTLTKIVYEDGGIKCK